jgi:hypothetical protein
MVYFNNKRLSKYFYISKIVLYFNKIRFFCYLVCILILYLYYNIFRFPIQKQFQAELFVSVSIPKNRTGYN